MTGTFSQTMKTCSGCKERLPLSRFSLNQTSRDGLHSKCNPCRGIANKLRLLKLETSGKSETSGIVTPAVEILNKMPGVLAMRLNSGVAQRGGRYIRLSPEGTADIFAVCEGQAFFFEAKRPGEKQSPEQKAFSIKAVDAGAKYFVITAARQAAEEIAIWRQR